MWLYRAKIVVSRRAAVGSRSAALRADGVVAFLPASWPARCSPSSSKRVLYTTPAVIAWSFIIGGIVMLVVERYRPGRSSERRTHTSLTRALGLARARRWR